MKKNFTMLMATLVVGLAMFGSPHVSNAFPIIWDVTADYDANNNPTGDWSYGWEPTVGGAFTLSVG